MKFHDALTNNLMKIPIVRVFATVFLLWLAIISAFIQNFLTHPKEAPEHDDYD